MAGAKAISYTPPYTKEQYREIMSGYRERENAAAVRVEDEDLLELL